MIFHKNILYIETADLLAAGKTRSNVDVAVAQKSKAISSCKIPELGASNYFKWDNMSNGWRECIEKRFGNPYHYIGQEPILKMVVADAKAEDFYLSYRYDNKALPIKTVRKYTRAACWLNMLGGVQKNRQFIKKTLNLSIPEFYTHVGELVKMEKANGKDERFEGIEQLSGDFPATYQRLMNRVCEYGEKGYEYLIDEMFGNKISAKIGKSEYGFDAEIEATQIALIRKAASLHGNFDSMQIARAVAPIFKKNGWKVVSHGTVNKIIKENEHLITAGRRGARVYNSTMAMQVKRHVTQQPLAYCTLDGWTAELLYQEDGSYHNRLVVVVVLDACCKYPLGYAIGDRENTDLIRQANRNALIHANEIFEGNYRPWQLQSDRYGLKNLTPFYQSMAHLHTPAAVGNAKAKIVEPYFMYLNKEYCQRVFFNNWSGFNLNSKKENQPNVEMLDKMKHHLPNKQGVIRQIEMIMEQERKIKITEYMQLWNATPTEDRALISKENKILVFGVFHEWTNSIEGKGLVATLGGKKLVYDSFDPQFRANQHLPWQIVYDENDLTEVVAINDTKKLRFLLHQKMSLAMDVRNTTPQQLEYRKQITNFNNDRKEQIMQTYLSDSLLVDDVINKTDLSLNDFEEAALKLMFTHKGQQKESLQDAKRLGKINKKELQQVAIEQVQSEANWQEIQAKYLQEKTDFNQYLD